ncbi:hypothetical protein J7T55_003070 [Diaporthe amygdali]|uniref:uncharacterized protein n=1 Tax=Phomopsis amygdali TaxID=1214568 RepID=UPI0022FEAFA9|nr:uncharacterized protein J7T55_003070 [Diaporthe amygdali]KAJ0122556.1 hypothetical protein J7T55_003070 [Diaporthe amygdali]
MVQKRALKVRATLWRNATLDGDHMSLVDTEQSGWTVQPSGSTYVSGRITDFAHYWIAEEMTYMNITEAFLMNPSEDFAPWVQGEY